MLQVITESGSFVPPGALVYFEGQENPVPIGHVGNLYLANATTESELTGVIRRENKSCQINVSLPESIEPLADLGQVVCLTF